MLYPKNTEKQLSSELFQNPTKEYRGAPFWAWNCKLTKQRLQKQIGILKQMGFGGFHMHSRTGMATPYLSDDFFDLVKFCADEGERQDMLAWAYDEDRWPSGSAGGLVTKEIRFRGKRLLLTPNAREDVVSMEDGIRTGNPWLYACYDIVLDEQGYLKSSQVTDEASAAAGSKWYAYILTNENTPWYNNQAYVDTLSKEAMDRFIELTYEGYKKAVGDRFGTTVPAIFTDEPQFNMRSFLRHSDEKQTAELPWTLSLPDFYAERTGMELKADIPHLFWEKPNGGSAPARYRFTDCVSELFCRSFMDNCGAWCSKNGLYMSGHMMLEPTLELQSWAIGDVMRAYRSFTLPGMDILCERMEFSTAKQVQSTVHQFGREGMISELYGVTNWDYDFRGHKYQGDWQAALGVTVRVPHLSWMSMEGEAKRDYPASFNYQSPWFDQYPIMETHFARVATALTRGKPIVKVAVVHPTETYWLHAGPKDKTSDETRNLDEKFQNVINWLLFHHIDFDFISESLLPEQCAQGGCPLQVGCMQYDAVVVPGCETLRTSTVERLAPFQTAGGNLIFMGKCPGSVDGIPSTGVQALFQKSICIDYDRVQLLHALKKHRLLHIRNDDGLTSDNLIHALRQDGDCRWLFLAHGKKQWEHNPVQTDVKVQHDVVKPQNIRIALSGIWYPELYDTMTGSIYQIPAIHENGRTMIRRRIYENDSLLLKLSEQPVATQWEPVWEGEPMAAFDIKRPVPYSLEEENIYLLDRAEFSFDGEAFQPEEELLRLDNRLREQIGWPLRQKKIAQPWSMPEETPEHWITLRFNVESRIACDSIYLALEQRDKAKITWNGESITAMPVGYFTDEAIQKLPLPGLKPGENILTVTLPYLERGSLEWMYLLGDFGVCVAGAWKVITEKPSQIGFGDISRQGMPFYGGNICYETQLVVPDCDYVRIRATHYRGMFIKVFVDGIEQGNILFAPYTLNLKLSKGVHTITFQLYGNRHNSFAALHNADDSTYYYGPDAWRTQSDSWAYEYRLKDMGILKSPVFEFIQKK